MDWACVEIRRSYLSGHKLETKHKKKNQGNDLDSGGKQN